MTIVIDGKAIAASLRETVAVDAKRLSDSGRQPGLCVIMVGDNPASDVYVRNKIAACEKTGIRSFEHRLPASATQGDVEQLIRRLNTDEKVHGILLQLPVPEQIDSSAMIHLIAPEKDVDGLHPLNLGRLMAGLPGMVPCTPQGSLLLIKDVQKDLSGLHAVVIGRSILFGKPMAQLLLGENCTVTQAHSKTRDLPAICRSADILVAAIGRPEMIKGDWVKTGAIVIDVGINRMDDGKLKGDVDFPAASLIARAITPVPGGVGPMTIACLLANTVKAAKAAS
ncbi:MAG: bifunctional methylenetetrahydrofolate dehydrogenase/methenyltetrahydrofolate cyclohydrolase FolD [Micavibrio sp.]